MWGEYHFVVNRKTKSNILLIRYYQPPILTKIKMVKVKMMFYQCTNFISNTQISLINYHFSKYRRDTHMPYQI